LVCTAAMVLALMMVALALPAFAGGAGDEEDNDKESASGDRTRNGQIVFRRWFDPDQTKGALFTMNPDGSHVRQITHPPKGWRDESPVWSPNGTKVAFERQRIDESMSRIMLIDLKTGDVREVTHCGPNQGQPKQGPPGRCESDFDPAFSPDGHSIAFRRIIGPDKRCCGFSGIFIVGLDGSDPQQVTNVDPKLPAEFSDAGPTFSPDGKTLVIDRERRGQKAPKLEAARIGG
jgi:Tol biopolymer transport system component